MTTPSQADQHRRGAGGGGGRGQRLTGRRQKAAGFEHAGVAAYHERAVAASFGAQAGHGPNFGGGRDSAGRAPELPSRPRPRWDVRTAPRWPLPSPAAARRVTPSAGWSDVTCNVARVSVPVLSNAIALTAARRSRCTPPLSSTPRRAPPASADTIDTGVEITSAHGHDTTSRTSAR